MAIKKYTNIEQINNKVENEGKFIQQDDLFVISKNEFENVDFGDCKYDVMEVSVYDINNNLLPQKSGKNVAYIKTGDIKNYMYNVTNKGGQKELAINAEKLLKDLGFSNGILKLNLNFVRNKVGSENDLEKVWIQEISPSREEIRIIPLKTKDNNISKKNEKQFNDFVKLSKDFKYQKKSILDGIYAFEGNLLEKIDSELETKFGKDFFTTLKADYGLNKFSTLKKQIFEDIKISVDYYLNNKVYDIESPSFGKKDGLRFEDCETYDYKLLVDEIQKIIFKCVSFNLKGLKRRDITIKNLPKEFDIVTLKKQIEDNLKSFETKKEIKVNVYEPDKVDINVNDTTGEKTIEIIKEKPKPILTPKGTLLSTECKGVDKYGIYADGSGGSYYELIETNATDCGYTPPTPPPTPTTGGGGGGRSGGGYTIQTDFNSFGREVVVERDMMDRQNLQ